ncbi:response regulator [candidate division KSB1 bacterium]|nr:response regulator [candidate division KSB1 bacterium]
MRTKKKILIVDEDANYISGLRKELTKAGYEVIYWSDGKKALDLSNNFRPDLIISEVDLTTNDGHAFFRDIKTHSEFKDIPFIFLSSQKRVDDRIKSMEIGVDDFIAKPFYVEEVVARIENIFSEIKQNSDARITSGKGFSGYLHEMNLVDLIQTLEVGQKSAIIKLNFNDYDARVYVRNGEIFDARFLDLPANDALARLFLWTEGSYQVEFTKEDFPRTLNQPTEKLLSEGIKRNARWDQIKKNLPPLNTIVAINKIAYEENSISNDEKQIIRLINKHAKIYDIITKSPLDDIKSLEIVDNLYRKGYLQESNKNYQAQPQNQVERIKQNLTRDHSENHNVSAIISNLLKKNSDANILEIEKRRDDRRQLVDRRRYHRRRNDIPKENKIYLDRTELLLIREKLL